MLLEMDIPVFRVSGEKEVSQGHATHGTPPEHDANGLRAINIALERQGKLDISGWVEVPFEKV